MAVLSTLTPEQAKARRARRESRRRILRHMALLAWTGFVIFPIYWMVMTSFKDSGEWVTWPPNWIPREPTLLNYSQIFAFGQLDASQARQARPAPYLRRCAVPLESRGRARTGGTGLSAEPLREMTFDFAQVDQPPPPETQRLVSAVAGNQ